MQKENILQDAVEVLNRPAVTFETDRRYNNQRAWPFLYPFVPKPYLETDTENAGLGLLGITIPAGQVKDISISLDRDTVYRQLNVKYTPFRCAIGTPIGVLTMTTIVGDATVVASSTNGLAAGNHIAWLDDAGNIQRGVIESITDGTDFELEKVATTTTTAMTINTCEMLWYDTVASLQAEAVADLTGTIEIPAGTDDLTGVGTNFDPEIVVGDVIQTIDANGNTRFFEVATRTNDTTATITETMGATDSVPAGSTFKKVGNVQGAGTITVDPVNRLVTGVATFFLDGDNTPLPGLLRRGDQIFYVDVSGVVQSLIVGDVVTDLLLKSSNPVTASGAGVTYALAVHTNASSMVNISGTSISIPTISQVVTGVGTVFTEQFTIGDRFQVVDLGGTLQLFTVASITSDLILGIVETTGGDAGTDNVAVTSALQNMPFIAGARLPTNLFRYKPLTQFLRVSYVMSSLRGRYLYGGTQEFLTPSNPADSGLQERPHLISALQGADSGLGMLRTPMVFPYSAICKLRITNLFTEDIILNGSLFGYKITLGEN